jgi:hypothetical protein
MVETPRSGCESVRVGSGLFHVVSAYLADWLRTGVALLMIAGSTGRSLGAHPRGMRQRERAEACESETWAGSVDPGMLNQRRLPSGESP